ncbi:MAG TPA: agmatinase [Candidatus Acidoferrales bacterium]|nr:agmatinase [Candidatus Acidoferrales bacterium]
MSNIELFTSHTNVFGGKQQPFEKASYIVFGVPFDATSSYRNGARFMPDAVRKASLNIETYSFRSAKDFEDISLCDVGDLDATLETKQTLDMCKAVAEDVWASGKTPVAIGGEHLITLGILKGLNDRAKNTAVVSFDAHLDLRKEFLGVKLSHTTFMRLVNEQVKPSKIIEVGTRSVCQEELDYAKKSKIDVISTQEIRSQGALQISQKLKEKLAAYENLYLSIDMDILDPAFAPATQNPEADGICTGDLLDIVCSLCDKKVVGFDVVEIAPVYDEGISAIAAAKIIFEVLCHIEKSKESH